MSGTPQSDPSTWNRDLASLHPDVINPPDPPPEEDAPKEDAPLVTEGLFELDPPTTDEEVKELFEGKKKKK